jgi:mRNA interferase YafQ
MREAAFSKQFDGDVRLLERRGKDLGKLQRLVALLLAGEQLPPEYKDHPLKGRWVTFRDAHLEPDWVVIYKIIDSLIRFERRVATATSSANS